MNSLTLKADLKDLYKLNTFIESKIQKSDFKLDLLVEEIFVNIVSYSECSYIKINLEFRDDTLTIEFIDDGFEFNPLLKKDPEKPKSIDEAKVGGLGIFLSKQIAEMSYKYLNGENHLKVSYGIK